MRYFNIIIKLYRFILILLFLLTGLSVSYALEDQNQDQVKSNRKQAQDLMNSNKNAPALEILELTGKLQDKIFTTQRDSTAAILEADFVKNKKIRQAEISAKQQEIKELKSGNEDIDRENFKMIRNTLLFFGTLIGLAVLLLLNRFRKLSQLNTQLLITESQLAETEKIIAGGVKYGESKKRILTEWNEVLKSMSEAAPLILKISNDKQHPLHKPVQQIQHSILSGQAILNIDETTEAELPEKYPVDLNQMIEESVNLAYYYTSSEYPEFNCTVVKDLEKILPKVELLPSDIRFVLFNLLSNAFEAIREKRTNAPKGYEPRVTVSTRKLPRFIQIRIRDNGAGILEKNPDQVFEAFYSSKNDAKHTGLGLAESKKIITGTYKGELFIESDFTTGTDFIIRFPILTLM